MFVFFHKKLARVSGQMEKVCNNNGETNESWVRTLRRNERRRETLKKYVKTLLYSYPRMAQMEKNYEEHILNKACLSFDNRKSGEFLVEEVAKEVLKKQLLKEVAEMMGKVVSFLTEKEKYLLELRYFRRKKALAVYEEKFGQAVFGSVRGYFREQVRLLEKTARLMVRCGLTEEKMQEYMQIDELQAVLSYIEKGRDKASSRERALVGFLGDGKA